MTVAQFSTLDNAEYAPNVTSIKTFDGWHFQLVTANYEHSRQHGNFKCLTSLHGGAMLSCDTSGRVPADVMRESLALARQIAG